MDDFKYDQLVLEINQLVTKLEGLEDSQIKNDIFDLLQKFDLLHREALLRLINIIQNRSSSVTAVMKKDFVIQTLLMLYGFVPPEDIPQPSVNDGTFIPIDQIQFGHPRKPKQPIWLPLGNLNELPPGSLKVKRTEETDVLLCRVEDKIFALRNACLQSILPLAMGQLEGHILICPWHGCRYDVRSGELQNGSGSSLETYPVQIAENGRIMIGFNIDT